MSACSLHGRGPRKVIALHGLFDTRAEFVPMLAGLDPDLWQVAMPDLRGFGELMSCEGPYDMGAIASGALALAADLGWGRFSVIGHSMSSKASLRLALLEPARVDRIIAIAPVWAGKAPLDEAGLAWFRSAAASVQTRAEIIAAATGDRLPRFWSDGLAARSFSTSRAEAFAAYVESFVHEDFAEAARAVRQPVLVVLGANDMVDEAGVQTTWLSELPNARLALIPDAGHWPMLETPLLLGRLVGDFLT